jgi:hypothetical protein
MKLARFPLHRTMRSAIVTILIVIVLFLAVAAPPLYLGFFCRPHGAFPEEPKTEQEATMLQQATSANRDYARREERTYLTFPEWHVVYSADEYANFIAGNPPSGFPYFSSAVQYLKGYCSAVASTRGRYPFNTDSHVMLAVIGASFAAEQTIKGVYENTAGKLAERIFTSDTEEDRFARNTAREYGVFIHTTPYYEFPYFEKLSSLWKETGLIGPHLARKAERKLFLSLEYGLKGAHGWIMTKIVRATYEPQAPETYLWVRPAAGGALPEDERIEKIKEFEDGSFLIRVPRYQAFTEVALALASNNASFIDIAGNDEILVTAVVPRDWLYTLEKGQLLFTMPILTDIGKSRVGIRAPVKSLTAIINALVSSGLSPEHLYDY